MFVTCKHSRFKSFFFIRSKHLLYFYIQSHPSDLSFSLYRFSEDLLDFLDEINVKSINLVTGVH